MSKHDAAFLDTNNHGPRPTPYLPNPAFSIIAQSTINAPPAAVHDALLDLPNYSAWNTFIASASMHKPAPGPNASTTHMHEGAVFAFRVRMSETQESTSYERVTLVEPVKTPSESDPMPTIRTTWVYETSSIPLLAWLLPCEHVNELTDLGDGRTEYVHYENFGGLLGPVIGYFQGENVAQGFRNWAKDLKAYVEKKQGTAGS